LKGTLNFIQKHLLLIIGIVSVIGAFLYAPGPHENYRETVSDFVVFCLWWIGLGVASSIGLGTGLHTFVLYLGPHIAKITMATNACNYVPEMLPSRWSFTHFKQCPEYTGTPTVPVTEIYRAVIFEAFLWGLGTAIGELPPYFVARAASLAGRKHEELEEMLGDGQKEQTFMDKMKHLLYRTLKQNAFVAVTLCASIPNPLFDLAGLTCGHFLIPFGVFFGATFIGKSIIKVSI